MLDQLLASPLVIFAATCGVLGAVLVIAGLAALWRARLLRFAGRTLLGLLLLSSGLLIGTVALGVQGYRALTHEEIAARIIVRPDGAQHFTATFYYPDEIGRAHV